MRPTNRTLLSNRLATHGREWMETFSRYHSGTYANQWMVLDLTKFTQYQPPQPEFLMVLEELPGITHYEDLTAILSVRNPLNTNI
jgi:N-glycosylase/DNA lyase